MSIYLTIKIYVLTTIITQPTQPALFYCARPIRVNGMCDPSYSCQIRILESEYFYIQFDLCALREPFGLR